MSVAVVGAGSWGTAFAKCLADGGNDVTIWARRRKVVDEINYEHRNGDYLPEIWLPENLTADLDVASALRDVRLVFLAIPAQKLRAQLGAMSGLFDEQAVLISLSKGLEKGTRLRMSEVIHEALDWPEDQIASLSGPNIALEIAQEQPSAAAVAATTEAVASEIAAVATNSYFSAFTNTDLVGTEFGGTLKNLVAVAVGIVAGVGYGENTKASIITRGLAEITRFAVQFGAKPTTMAGLAGLGDLIATCESPLSRNHTAGRLLGEGKPLSEVIDRMQQTAEGLSSVAPVLELARVHGIAMPIVTQVSEVLAGTMDPRDIAPHLTSEVDSPVSELG
ncbi:MAG: NAD(P)-dependent glycerol-3-phosphate dehydrogenase [Microbacteriaceae bacterium]|nr:NAD(P)-dependent glycerol-3-phosphate dehydrogenase [Microbacteriaceae bacterium]MCI1207798.1 NAD(P)-dependent glycerol-3-phosphate dehydrogenase [Microbacteriaceae bacterium]